MADYSILRIGSMEPQAREAFISEYSQDRKKKLDNVNVDQFANDIASVSLDEGSHSSFSLLYDKALSNPKAIGMTKKEVKDDRGMAVVKIAKQAYHELSEDIFVDVLNRTDNPILAQKSADTAIDYFINNTANIENADERKAKSVGMLQELQSYTEDGKSFSGFSGYGEYLKTVVNPERGIIAPFAGDMNAITKRITSVNRGADISNMTQVGYAFAGSFMPTLMLEPFIDSLSSGQRKYTAYKESGHSSFMETAASISAMLIQARILGNGANWGAKQLGTQVKYANALSYMVTTTGTGALQDYMESTRGISQQFFTPMARTGGVTFADRYWASRGFDFTTAAIGAVTGSAIESYMFGTGLKSLTTGSVKKLIAAQLFSPIADTAMDLALDFTVHGAVEGIFGRGEPVFTNAQALQFSLEGMSAEQAGWHMANMFGTRLAARVGSGALNAAIAKRANKEAKLKNLMGSSEWYSSMIDASSHNKFLKNVTKSLVGVSNKFFGNNLMDLDIEYSQAYSNKKANFTEYLKGSDNTKLKDLVSLYLAREGQKNVIVEFFGAMYDGRITKELTEVTKTISDTDKVMANMFKIRENESVSVSRPADVTALAEVLGNRLNVTGLSSDDIKTEVNKFRSIYFMNKTDYKTVLSGVNRLVNDQGRRGVIGAVFQTTETAGLESLSTRQKVEYTRNMNNSARTRLTAADLPESTLAVDGVMSKFTELSEDLLKISDNKMRVISERGMGLLDEIVGGDKSVSELRTAAAEYLLQRGINKVSADNVHEFMQKNLTAFAENVMRESKDELKNIINTDPANLDPTTLERKIGKFNDSARWFGSTFSQSEPVRQAIMDTAKLYDNAPEPIKKMFNKSIRTNKTLFSDVKARDGADLFSTLLGDITSGIDNIRYNRYVMAVALGDGSEAQNFASVARLIEHGITEDVAKNIIINNQGFELAGRDDGDGWKIAYVDEQGRTQTKLISGEQGAAEIEAAIIHLKTTTKAEVDEGVSLTYLHLLQAANAKSTGLYGSRGYDTEFGNRFSNILIDMHSKGIIDYGNNTMSVRNRAGFIEYLNTNQDIIKYTIQSIESDFIHADPNWRQETLVTVSAKLYDKDAPDGDTIEVHQRDVQKILKLNATKQNINLENIARLLSQGYDRDEAIMHMASLIIDKNLQRGDISFATVNKLAAEMIDDSLEMRGRSTTLSLADDRLIRSVEFSAGIESVYSEEGHTFLTIDAQKLNDQETSNVNNHDYMYKTYGVVQLQPAGVNAKAVYMQTPDFTGKNSTKVLDLFWRSFIKTMSNRIKDRDTSVVGSTETPYSDRINDALMGSTDSTGKTTAGLIDDPPTTKGEINTKMNVLMTRIANIGGASIGHLLTRMGAQGDGTDPNTILDVGSRAVADRHTELLRTQLLLSVPVMFEVGLLNNIAANTALDALITGLSTTGDVSALKAAVILELNPTTNSNAIGSINKIPDNPDGFTRYALNKSFEESRNITTQLKIMQTEMGGVRINIPDLTDLPSLVGNLKDVDETNSVLRRAIASMESSHREIVSLAEDVRSFRHKGISEKIISADVLASGRSIDVSDARENENTNNIKREAMVQLRANENNLALITKGKSSGLRFNSDSVENSDIVALQLLGNMLTFGTKFLMNPDPMKRGAGTREVKHIGFRDLSNFIKKGNEVLMFGVELTKTDGAPRGAGLHTIDQRLYGVIKDNGGTKPVLTSDSGMIKSQFTKNNGHQVIIQDIITARNAVAFSQGRPDDILKIDSDGGVYRDMTDGSKKPVYIMTLDMDSVKQFSPDYQTSLHQTDEKTYFNMQVCQICDLGRSHRSEG